MEITLTVNGKQVKATVDEREMKETMGHSKQKTGYERAGLRQCYYVVCENGLVRTEQRDWLTPIDDLMFVSANYYTDEDVAKNNARADALMRKLRRFAAEHGGCLSQKTNVTQGYFYHIWWDNVQKQPTWMGNDRQLCGAVTFASKEDTIEAIKEFYTELVWYFTEYDPMPEGWWDS